MRVFDCIICVQGTEPSQLWVNDLDSLGVVLDEIAEIERKQEVEDAKQRKNAGKGKVRLVHVQHSIVYLVYGSNSDAQGVIHSLSIPNRPAWPIPVPSCFYPSGTPGITCTAY